MDLCEYNLVYDFSNIDNGIVYIVSLLYSVGSTSVSPPTTDGKYSGENNSRESSKTKLQFAAGQPLFT